MVSLAVSKLGCTGLIFVEPGVKVNGVYSPDVLLQKEMLPAIRSVAVELFIFQQDSAPAHRARYRCLNKRYPDSSVPICGLQTVQI